jgi:short-subunit dehydrogenase
VAAAGLEVDFLVNNAGYALAEPFLKTDWQAQADLIQVMSTGVVHLCHLFAPGMAARGAGWILNVASAGAWWPHVPGSLYNPIKLFVVEFTQALRAEVGPAGVKCCALCPGMTRTEFHASMGLQAQVDKLPGFVWMDAAEVARQGVAATLADEPVCVPGRFNLLTTALFKHLSLRLKSRMGGHSKHFE